MNAVSFPTQGEVIQFVFDALGILPRKHEDDPSFNETRKKSTQKALQRLSVEEGVLDQRLDEMIQTLSEAAKIDIGAYDEATPTRL